MRFVILFVVMALGAGPATRPTSQPATQAAVSLDEATRLLRQAESNSLTKLKATSGYLNAAAKRADAEKRLEAARKSGTPQEKLDASHDFVVVDQAVKAMEKNAIAGDPDVRAANARIAAMKAEIAARERAKKEAEIAEQNRIQNDPVHVAIREGRLIQGMAESDAELAFSNRKRRNLNEGSHTSGGAIDMSGNEAAGVFNAPPRDVVRKTQDELENGLKRVTFTRYRRYMNGSEYRTDELSVMIRDGKVVEIYGQ